MTHRFRYCQVLKIRIASTLLVFSSLFGCSSSENVPDLIPVSGSVVMDGKPATGVTLMFVPLAGTAGQGAYGVTDETGSYKLMHRSGELGCQPGSYAVTFSKITQPNGLPIPPDASSEEFGFVEQLPPVYTNFDPNFVIEQANVNGPEAKADFELNSKLKPPAGMSVHQN